MSHQPRRRPSQAFGNQCLSLGLVTALVVAFPFSATSAAARFRPRAGSQPMLSIVATDNGRTFQVPVGGLVRILLPENASTGYRWAIDQYSKETIEPVSTQSRYNADVVGSGGEVEFIFKALKIGTAKLTLKQWRHWEGDSSIIDRFFVNLIVQP
jgi:inhibitor of cysteine peptidase